MNSKPLSKVQRHTLNANLFLGVVGLHAAVVFAFEGTQLSPHQSDESFIEINIGLHAESMINMPTNEHDIQPVIMPAPQLQLQLQPEPQPESQPEPEPEPQPERSPVLKTATESPKLRVPQRSATNKHKPKNQASSAKITTATPTSTALARSPNPAPRKVSRLEYLGSPPRPAYPSRALKGREQGLVILRVVIDRSGSVMSAAVWQSSGSDALDQSALQALKTTRFKPYQDNGVTQEATADIPFNFVLKRQGL